MNAELTLIRQMVVAPVAPGFSRTARAARISATRVIPRAVTARPNGTRGTDHGTGDVGLVLGPRLARSTVLADWPGLDATALFEGRDLMPTLDTRAVLKAVLAGTFDLTSAQADRVFPGSEGVKAASALMR